MNVDLQIMDFPTMVRRRISKEPPDKGGWNLHFSIIDGLFGANPVTGERGQATTRLELASSAIAFSYEHQIRVVEP